MVTTVDNRWSRTRYPLTSSVEGQVQMSTVIPSKEMDEAAMNQSPKYSENLKNVVPWYHAVTELRERPVLQPGHFDSLTSRLEEADMPASEGSLTAVSWSRRSFSPSSHENETDSQLGHQSSRSLKYAINESSHHQNNSQESLGQQSIDSSSSSRPSSAGSERVPDHDQGLETSVTRKRTLRRTPRSRRIVEPIPVAEVGLPPYSTQQAVKSDESSTALSGPWRRLSYPLRATADADSAESAWDAADNKARLQHPELSSPKAESQILASRSDDSPRPENGSLGDEGPHLSPTDSERSSASAGQTKPVTATREAPQVQVGLFPQKRGYPLQSPASQSNIRYSPSPPPSIRDFTDEQISNSDIDLAEENSSPEPRVYRRPGYPLQMPTALFSLVPEVARSPPPTPPPAPDPIVPGLHGLASAVTKGQGRPWGYAELGTPRTAMTANVIDLQKYPLQLPAAAAETKPAESEIPTQDAQKSSEPTERVIQAPKKSLKRKVYPLQSPASIMDFKTQEIEKSDTQTPQAAKSKQTPVQQPAPDYENIPMSTSTPRRKGYPLQMRSATASTTHNAPSAKKSPIPVKAKEEPVSEEQHQSEAPQKSYSRYKYPLNSSAQTMSRSNESRSQQQKSDESVTKPGSNKKSSDRLPATSPVHEKPLRSSPPQVDEKTSSISQNPNRPAYPTQLAMPVPRRGVPALSITPESPDREKAPGEQSKEDELAKKVISQWRRQVYPTQSADKMSPFPRAVTPQPSSESLREKKHKKIHLPKNLSAVKNADDPPAKGRTIVVCLDGTGDKFDDDNSNIVHIVSALKKDDPNQVTYYQAGIGTYGEGGLSGGITAAMDMAVGAQLGLHVRDAYHFLMHTYKEGDKICIFGFSRGAYTARCVAGMVHKVGLLPPRNVEQIPFAYEFYANDTPEGWKQSRDFKKTFSIDVNVYFLGCFDSVASVGFIPRTLPLSTTPTNKPHYFRHAMALDERRAKFKVARHKKLKLKDINEVKENRSTVSATAHFLHTFMPFYRDQNDAPPEYEDHRRFRDTHHPNVTDEEYERLTAAEEAFESDVLEVWFAGAHADVGGGAVKNVERHKLAQIPLRWMIRQAFECNTGIIFHTKVLAEFGLDVHTLWPKYERLKAPKFGPPPSVLEKFDSKLPPREVRRSKLKSTPVEGSDEDMYHLAHPTDDDWTPEQIEDYYDAMSPMNDQLLQAPNWWILEFWPVQIKMPRAPGEVDIIVGMNFGRYRAAEEAEPLMHWTVRHRMTELGYSMGVRTAPQVTWTEVV